MFMLRRRTALLVASLAASLLAATACSTDTAHGDGTSGSAKSGKLKIALANSYIGNGWRVEMENVFKAACAMPPYNGQVDCSVYNAGNDVATQTQQITNLIAQRVDAIVLDAASPTGLNGVIQQACDRKILVVSFDNVVTAPCALKVNTDQVRFGTELAQFLVDQLHGTGNVVMVTGVPGTGVNEDRNKGAQQVFAKNPGIKVVAQYSGQWDSATAQRQTAAQLPSLPKVDGVWVQGGTDGVIKAFVEAHRPVPVVAGEAENGFRKYLAGLSTPKVNGLSIGQPPYLSVLALELARAVLRGEHAKADVTVGFPKVGSADLVPDKTVFGNEPDSFFDDFTDSGPNAALVLCLDAAKSGKACPGDLHVNLGSS
jgi:ribose transport system substrate-binding protein